MCLSDDPVADFHRHDRMQNRWLEQLPVCERCENHIQQERAVCIEGIWYCDKCLDEFRKDVNEG